MIAAGVLLYFQESDIKSFFSSLADGLSGAEIVFNTQSRLAKLRCNWGMEDEDGSHEMGHEGCAHDNKMG
jgi:O-methyltransferase involved in polyketide biosynthesis